MEQVGAHLEGRDKQEAEEGRGKEPRGKEIRVQNCRNQDRAFP